MSLNKDYAEQQAATVKQLLEKGVYDKATQHHVFGADSVNLPEGITPETITDHVNFFNNTASAVEVANAELTRLANAQNDKLMNTTGTYTIGGLTINTEHRLRQQVGALGEEENYVYGNSTTTVDYVHSDLAAAWLSEQRDSSVAQATALFAK